MPLQKEMRNGWKANMARFVVDAYAWIEYLEGSEKGKKVSILIENELNDVFTSSSTVAEIVSKFLRSKKNIKIALNCIDSMSTVVNVNREIGSLAGQIHFEAKKKIKDFGMLDAFVAATARSVNANILTGDPHFRNFKEAVMI